MKNTIKVILLALFVSFTAVACSNSDSKDCKDGDKKECCDKKGDKDKKECAADCKKECCADKDKQACEPGCKKECCKDKAGSDEANTVDGADGDMTHTCTNACHDDPSSCPGHS